MFSRIFLKENTRVGTSILKLAPESSMDIPLTSKYHIVDGNNNGAFQIIRYNFQAFIRNYKNICLDSFKIFYLNDRLFSSNFC